MKSRTLLITPHLEHTITHLQELMGGEENLELFITNPPKVIGGKRDVISLIRYYWLDPILTLVRLLPRLHHYHRVICYYHRAGYVVGIYRLLFPGGLPAQSIWIGFAPNPKRGGAKGWLKERLTAMIVRGHSLLICNTQPLVESARSRFPAVKDRLAYVRWGGSETENLVYNRASAGGGAGYVFCGGRTNRDFETVLAAVTAVRCPAVFVVAGDYEFKQGIPGNVKVYRDISHDTFERLMQDAAVVVIALERPDVSSGQVVLSTAMQNSRPIIVTRCAGMDDYVGGKSALLVRPHDPVQLAEKIATLLNDEGLRSKLSVSARQRFETGFNAATFARDIYAVLNEQADAEEGGQEEEASQEEELMSA